MENKVVLITGGNKGIGRAISEKFKKEGYTVVVMARTNPDSADFDFFPCDMSDNEQIAQSISEVLKKYNKIDVLVNNAGITKDGLMLTMSYEDFLDVIQVNLNAAFLVSKLISRGMLKKRSGKIINISSVVGLHGNAGQSNYSASKAGLIGLTKSMAKEFASRNIQVNAIAPGFIDTDMTAVLPEEFKEQWKKQIPLGRFGQPEEVANAVYFLASDNADYITGQVLSICGGMSI